MFDRAGSAGSHEGSWAKAALPNQWPTSSRTQANFAGFINVYSMLCSFVTDRCVYLASVGVIVGLWAWTVGSYRPAARFRGIAVAGCVIVPAAGSDQVRPPECRAAWQPRNDSAVAGPCG